MKSGMRRAFGDAAISIAALAVLVVLLVSVDDRVRERLTGMVRTAPTSTQLVGAGQEVGSMVALVFDAIRDQSVAHGPLVIFGVAATVLVLFMLRT